MPFPLVNFADRFRIAVRKIIHFNKSISKLGPMYYNCNERQSSCTRMYARPRQGCPNCEFTIQYKQMLVEMEKELKTFPKGTRQGASKWPMKKLIEMVNEISYIATTNKRNRPTWDVTTSMMVGIYRSEMSKMKAIDDYNHMKKMERASEKED